MDQLDQLDQLEASELEYNSSDDSFSDIESDDSLGADISLPQSRSPSPSPSPSPSLVSEPSIAGRTGSRYSIGARIQALTYLELGLPTFQIEAKTRIRKAQIYNIRKKALLRGWIPDSVIETYHINDSSRSGRPKASQEVVDSILDIVTKNSTTRGWSCERIA